jgi:hypothetical protein
VFIQPPAKALGNIPRATIQPNKDRIKIGNITYKIVTSKEVNPSLSNSVLIELYVRQ